VLACRHWRRRDRFAARAAGSHKSVARAARDASSHLTATAAGHAVGRAPGPSTDSTPRRDRGRRHRIGRCDPQAVCARWIVDPGGATEIRDRGGSASPEPAR
jgi:hypothetical protein